MDSCNSMQPILEEFYRAEERVALALRLIDSDEPRRREAISELSALYDEAQQLYKHLPVWVTERMAAAANP